MKKIIWIVVETPFKGDAGDFFIHGPYPSLEDTKRVIHEDCKCYDPVPLDITNLEIREI